ncbi:MAG: polysaccharide biosynthesis/export family protein [Opitutales bacterium]
MPFRCIFLGVFLAFGGVASLPAAGEAAAGAATTTTTPIDYILQPSDLIHILVFQEPDLERQVRITQESSLSLPLIGTVDLKGKSVRQAEELIRELYDKDYLVNPQITITVLEYSPRTVQVIGAVNQPGSITFPPEQKMSLVEAISRAGGPSRIANLRQVRITRTNAEGKTDNFTVNLDGLTKGDSSQSLQLQKGDVIYIPERII